MQDGSTQTSSGTQTTPHLSPRSMPQNSHRPAVKTPHPRNPFVSSTRNASPASLYGAPPPYPPAQMMENGEDVRFGSVDWKIQKPEPTRPRSVTHGDEAKTVGVTRPRPTSKPYHTPSPSPSPYITNPNNRPGLGINFDQNHYSPIDEKDPSGVSSPPLTYFTPYRQENFRTNLEEKHDWEPSQAPGSDPLPFPDFEDVELARPQPGANLPPQAGPQAEPQVLQVKRRRPNKWIWIAAVLLLLIPLLIWLIVFGGVFHWDYHNHRCVITGGKWIEDTKTCEYR